MKVAVFSVNENMVELFSTDSRVSVENNHCNFFLILNIWYEIFHWIYSSEMYVINFKNHKF